MSRTKLALLATVFLLALTPAKSNDINKTMDFIYEGGVVDTIELEAKSKETRYKYEEVDSTCTRQESYYENECGYETKYRQECHTEPSRRECRDVRDRVCEDVTKSERVCRPGPRREVCRNSGPRQVCRDVPPKRVCRDQGGKTVCRMKNGGRQCREVPGERICRMERGPDVCKRERKVVRECRNVTRNECRTIPSRRVCNDIPYDEYVCRDVLKYRDVNYACKKTVSVPYEVKVTNKARVDFVIKHKAEDVKLKVKTKLKGANLVTVFKDLSEESQLVFVKKNEDSVLNDLERLIDVNYKVRLINKEESMGVLKKKIRMARLSKRYVRITTGVIDHESTEVFVKVTKNGKTIINAKVNDTTHRRENPSERETYQVMFSEFGEKLSRLNRYNVEVMIKVDPAKLAKGELVSDVKAEDFTVTKSFNSIKPERK